MLFLVFYVGRDRYAVESTSVVEVIPRVVLRQVPQAPAYVAGLFNYRGTIVPVIDLCALIRGTPCSASFSTRIVVVDRAVSLARTSTDAQLIGLMAERVTETLNEGDAKPTNAGVPIESLYASTQAYQPVLLGETLVDDRGIIQCLRLKQLMLTPEATVASTATSEVG